jgi:hypothetical protein
VTGRTGELLTELFDGAVVCNAVGPFAQHGREVVEACITADAGLPRSKAGKVLKPEIKSRLSASGE